MTSPHNKPTSSDSIECPKCGEFIPITETLQHQLTERARKEFEEKLTAQERDFSVREKQLNDKQKELEDREKGIEQRVKAELEKGIQKERDTIVHSRRAC